MSGVKETVNDPNPSLKNKAAVPSTTEDSAAAAAAETNGNYGHRRVSSEGPSGGSSNGYGFQFPPTQISYPNKPPSNSPNPAALPPGAVPLSGHERSYSGGSGGGVPYPQPYPVGAYGGYYQHNVAAGFPPMPYPYPYPPQHQAPGVAYPPGYGIPMQMPQDYHAHYQQQQQQQQERGRKDHRRSNSYSGSGAGGMFGPAPPTHGSTRPPRSRSNSGDFSPRDEFRKLTGSSNRSLQGSNGSPAGSPRPPPITTAALHNSFRGGGGANGGVVYGMDPNSPSVIGIDRPGSERSNDLSGEAVFLANSGSSKKGHRKQGSTRRMHMRQQSAQLFMEDVKGVEQLPSCRDVVWTLLFLFHLLGIVYLGNTYGYEALRFHDQIEDEKPVTIIYRNIIYVASLSGILSMTVSALALFLMTLFVKQIIQVALCFTITLSFAWGTIGIGLSPKKVVPATGIIALALSIAYAFISWDRIPFSSSNLHAALTGIKENPGAILLAFIFQFLALVWSVYFTYVAVGVYDAIEDGDFFLTYNGTIAMYCAMGVSYYWTFHVFMNVVQVAVAGVIGAWWFTPEGDFTTRKRDLNRSFFRSIFYAFGSVCFGSLLVGPVRILRQLSALFRPSDDSGSLMCFDQCISFIQSIMTKCVDNISNIFSPWAFTYVGLYGYDLVEAGRNSAELFERRGWTTIVSDDLVPNALLLTSLVIGGVTGLFAHLIENLENLSFSNIGQPGMVSFALGGCVGLVVTSVLFGIIGSSVNAVIVCFAASPVDFEQNHPELSHEMRKAWREVWPGCMDVVDLRVAAANYTMDPMAGVSAMPTVLNGFHSERSPLLRQPS